MSTVPASPASAAAPATHYTAPRGRIWCWGVGTLADAILILSFGLVFPIFNTGFGLSAEKLSLALTLPRLVDGLVEPFFGYWSDHLQTRWGRRKPFLLFSSLVGAVIFAALWWLDTSWPETVQFAYVVVFATLYYTAWGVFSMTHQALGFELTDDYHERSRVFAIRNIFLQVVTLGVGWIYPVVLLPVFGGEVAGIRVVSGVLAVIVIAAALVTIFTVPERFSQGRRHGPPTPIWRALREALGLRAFRTYLALRFSAMFGFVVFNQLIFYINVYHVCAGDKKLATTIIGIGTALTVGVTIVMLTFARRISQQVGKRRGVIIGAGISVFQAAVVPFLYTPAWPYLQLGSALLLAPLVAMAAVLRDAIVPDLCDVDELENGERREALFTAVVSFVYKLEVSLCIALVGFMLKWSAFDHRMTVQAPEVLTRLQWCAYVPNLVFAVVALYFAWRFPLSEQAMIEVHERLARRRAGGAVPAGASH
jgi:GPH family glycoside/pentoside/hexuronide:cation symporter